GQTRPGGHRTPTTCTCEELQTRRQLRSRRVPRRTRSFPHLPSCSLRAFFRPEHPGQRLPLFIAEMLKKFKHYALDAASASKARCFSTFLPATDTAGTVAPSRL